MFEVEHEDLIKALTVEALDPQDLLGLVLVMGEEETPVRVIAVHDYAVDLQHRVTDSIVRGRSLFMEERLQQAVWSMPPDLHGKMQSGLERLSGTDWKRVLGRLFADPERLRRQEPRSFGFLTDMRARYDRNPQFRPSQRQEKWLSDVLARRTRGESR